MKVRLKVSLYTKLHKVYYSAIKWIITLFVYKGSRNDRNTKRTTTNAERIMGQPERTTWTTFPIQCFQARHRKSKFWWILFVKLVALRVVEMPNSISFQFKGFTVVTAWWNPFMIFGLIILLKPRIWLYSDYFRAQKNYLLKNYFFL